MRSLVCLLFSIFLSNNLVLISSQDAPDAPPSLPVPSGSVLQAPQESLVPFSHQSQVAPSLLPSAPGPAPSAPLSPSFLPSPLSPSLPMMHLLPSFPALPGVSPPPSFPTFPTMPPFPGFSPITMAPFSFPPFSPVTMAPFSFPPFMEFTTPESPARGYSNRPHYTWGFNGVRWKKLRKAHYHVPVASGRAG
uniref:Uncharacterized protein n=1 Tax=Acrobeloides nanus TaxID=290746 RepID=A0A914BU78_9BILA